MLPPELLQAIAEPAGGRIVMVIGAGCSYQAPTSLPLATECAEEAYRRLRADGILREGDCPNPSDLSALADVVVSVTGGQRALVERLPMDDFRRAEANEGYLLLAAMMRERSIHYVLTLNFDLAVCSALVRMGGRNDVTVVRGPEEHGLLSAASVIYLHRSVDADPEAWILTSAKLDDGWRNNWEELITNKVLGAPITIFAGLGTPAAVLLQTVGRIRSSLPGGVRIYQADPVERSSSIFFSKLGLGDESYLQMDWCDFMRQAAARLAMEHRACLVKAATKLRADEGLDLQDVSRLKDRVEELGLLELGNLRASFTLDESPYLPQGILNLPLVADLLIGVAFVERATDTRSVFFPAEGVVEFRAGSRILCAVVLASGRGSRRWGSLEVEIERRGKWQRHDPRPRCALVAGVNGGRPQVVTPPRSILGAEGEGKDDIINGDAAFGMYSLDELRQDLDLIGRALMT